MPNLNLITYPQLVRSIDQEFQHGIFEAKKQLERQRLATYWKVGELLGAYFKAQGIRSARARQEIFRQAGKDLNQDANFIKKTFLFYQAYPRIPDQGKLSWSHYRTLVTIPQKSRRAIWEKRIVEAGLPSDAFYDLFRRERASASALPEGEGAKQNSPVTLPVTRGRLYTYQIIPESKVPWSQGYTVVDLGFCVRHEIPALSGADLDTGKVFESRVTPSGYELVRVPVTCAEIYTYKARVERVVDGDTLVVNIDCGFRVWVRERLRLNRIDAPELATLEGRRAKWFTEEQLAGCEFVVLKTTRTDSTDIYGRYLADVFFMPGETDPQRVAAEGAHLNQLLIDEGQAVVYGSNGS